MKYLLFYSTYFILSFISCFKEDTCNKKLGETFESLEVASAGFDENRNYKINISLQTLDTLPLSYFEDVVVITHKLEYKTFEVAPNSAGVLKDLQMSATDLQLTILQDSLPQTGETNSLLFYLEFPDRRAYIDCMHPGSDDRYQLDLEIDIERISPDSIHISRFFWEERLELGGF